MTAVYVSLLVLVLIIELLVIILGKELTRVGRTGGGM